MEPGRREQAAEELLVKASLHQEKQLTLSAAPRVSAEWKPPNCLHNVSRDWSIHSEFKCYRYMDSWLSETQRMKRRQRPSCTRKPAQRRDEKADTEDGDLIGEDDRCHPMTRPSASLRKQRTLISLRQEARRDDGRIPGIPKQNRMNRQSEYQNRCINSFNLKTSRMTQRA